MKKLNCLFISLITILMLLVSSTSNFVNAQEDNSAPNNGEESYQQLINEGILDPSVSKEQWDKFKTEDKYYAEQQEQEEIDNPVDVSDSENGTMLRSAKSKFSLRKGDFFYTNATDSKGLTGHNAIYVGNGKVVQAPAKGYKTTSLSFTSWKKQTLYGKKEPKKGKWIKVYRPSSSANGNKAANYAMKNFGKKHIPYKITGNIKSKKYEYCSKLVWQSYYFGAGKKAMASVNTPVILHPSNLPGTIKSTKKVHTYKK
ncbi:NlpC/P60 family protein [Staphylococcus equorum]|uniref:YiiX/YebB-like N1pC/P60 family cysteine hydrolase n=2 Tax=Staphylococcus equorum TaxID=246432 RepID=UPI002553572B|nr:YiiX/YebB-like N1pC/P60 family cysteine hydrolase [Staphylococcus equorum]MDK9847729.1 NlpC/P60 family protein [Staphylococcus equorum]